MDPVEFRPFTEEERRALKGLATSRGELANDFFGTLCVFGLVLGLELGAIRLVAGRPKELVLDIAAGIALLVALWVLVHMRRSVGRALRGMRATFARDLAGGRAARQTFEVQDAVAVAETEDEGASYYLKLADGAVLFVSGQYLDEYKESCEFPSTRFAVTRAPESRIVLDFECLGQPLPARAQRPPFTVAEHHADAVPEDGALLALDFESVRREARSARDAV